MPKKPSPGAALRHMIEAAKALDPELTDSAVARAIGVSQPALTSWCEEDKTPTARNRLAIERWMSGLLAALPRAWTDIEAADVAANVTPFTAKAS